MYDSTPSCEPKTRTTEGTPSPQLHGAAQSKGEQQALLNQASPGEPPRWRLLASSIGLLADAYDIFAIDTVVLVLRFVYGEQVIDQQSMSLIASASLLGIIVGQLAFGLIADMVGRKWAFVATAALTIVGAAASACTADHPGIGFRLPAQLALCRFILGVGIGGEYPLSASVTAEATEDRESRGLMLATVISMQGWGMLLSSLMALICLGFGCGLELLWRFLLAFGALPSAIAFILRWQLHESDNFTKAQQDSGDDTKAQRTTLLKEHWKTLLGTSASWLLMNISLYSLGSFKSTVLHRFMNSGSMTERSELVVTSRFAACTSCFAIAGFGTALLLINRMGRFWMQLGGFAALAILFLIQASLSSPETKPPLWLFVTLLGLVFYFQNFGPNTTTYIIPAEAFPTLIRATSHGISAACGKVGAFVGTMAFPAAEAALGMKAVYFACAVTAVIGTLVTYRLTPRTDEVV